MDKDEIIRKTKRVDGLAGMTVNESLVATGLLETFDVAKKKDIELAKTILQAIGVDETSIESILDQKCRRIQTASNRNLF